MRGRIRGRGGSADRRDENGRHPQAAAEFNIDKRVADHDAGCGGDGWEPGRGLVEEARERLAAVALAFVVRAEEEGVDMRAVAA